MKEASGQEGARRKKRKSRVRRRCGNGERERGEGPRGIGERGGGMGKHERIGRGGRRTAPRPRGRRLVKGKGGDHS